MKRNRILIKTIAIVILLQLIILPTTSNAGFWGDIFKYGDDWIKEGSNPVIEGPVDPDGNPTEINTAIDQENLASASSAIFNTLFGIGVVLSVIVGGIIGIQYIMASAEDKAKIKESMMPYVLGCAVIFGAYGIWKFVYAILQNIS